MDPAIARTEGGRVLRLVNAAVSPSVTTLRERNTAACERAHNVAQANVRAANLSGDDARWIFAQQVRHTLEGGRAAILPPSRRRQLIDSATRQGMRPFDANLVIAIVQDDVRTSANSDLPTLSLVRPPQAPPGIAWTIGTCAAIGLLSLAMLSLLIAWITG